MLISVVRNGGKKTVGDLLSTISTQPVVACVILLKLKGKIRDIQFEVCKIEQFKKLQRGIEFNFTVELTKF